MTLLVKANLGPPLDPGAHQIYKCTVCVIIYIIYSYFFRTNGVFGPMAIQYYLQDFATQEAEVLV